MIRNGAWRQYVTSTESSVRTVFFVSDHSGVTAETMGHSLLSQFEGTSFRSVTLPFISTLQSAEEALQKINATAAIAELGYSGMQGEHMVVVENTPRLHNLVVCTLCSCYPWPILGLPPVWYKSAPYRSRSVIDWPNATCQRDQTFRRRQAGS